MPLQNTGFVSSLDPVRSWTTPAAANASLNTGPSAKNLLRRNQATSILDDKGQREVVFVVDDEHVIAESAAQILRAQGFDARAFTSPRAAWTAAQVDPPRVLLADVIMPDINGFELSSGILQMCPQCKVLLFSGDPSALVTYALTPVEKSFPFLIKPVQPQQLLSAIRDQLDS